MRKLNLKGIVIVSTLTILLTGCTTTNETTITNQNSHNNEPTSIVQQENIRVPETKPVIEHEETTPVVETNENSDTFSYFEDAKQEIIDYIESEDFEQLKSKGKNYVTTGIDFIFFDEPINNVYFDDLKETAKQDIIRDVKSLDETIMAYYPDYKEDISSKYNIAAEFLSEKYYDVLDYIKEYLGEENYNAVGEIKDQVIGDVSNKANEVVEDIKELYKGWKNK